MGYTRADKLLSKEELFKSRIEIKHFDECWLWKGPVHKRRKYGEFWYNNKYEKAHRVSWEIFNQQKIPKGFVICHRCDNPQCVNPFHLFLGTQKDNIYDMHSKNRSEKLRKATHASDETHQVSKLTNDEVRFIRSSDLSTTELRKLLNFKVELLAIRRVKHRETYRDVK